MENTAFIYDESYFWHDNGNGALFLQPGKWVEPDTHVENPSTKRRVKNLLDKSNMLSKLKNISPKAATVEQIELFHTSSYINKVKELSDTTGGDAGEFAIVGKGSYEIALLSVGGALKGVDAVIQGLVENAYVLTRPPGHHAEADYGVGFCLFNNVAIAAKHAKEKYDLKKILIIDWDVHHGNGTESAFYKDPEVLFISIHQEYMNELPGRGHSKDRGVGAGTGFNINIPLPPGTSDAGYMYAFEKIIKPIADQYQPELILVSAGQDPSFYDPLGRMMVTANGFHQMTLFVKELAAKYCNSRLVICHEGGYSAPYVPFCSLKIIEALSAIDSGVEDPFAESFAEFPINKVRGIEKESVSNVKNTLSKYWYIN